MARKPITRVNNAAVMSNNYEDKDVALTILLKRMCTFEEAMDYLLSVIPEIEKDDMLEELATWDGKKADLMRLRANWQNPKIENNRFWLNENELADRALWIKRAHAHGVSYSEIAKELNLSVSRVRQIYLKKEKS